MSKGASFEVRACVRGVLAAGALLILGSETAWAAAGKVLLVSGSVSLEREGSRSLLAGETVNAGDVIVTGAGSRVQLLMADGARVALREASRFRIDEIQLPSIVQRPGADSSDTASGGSIGTLLKGGISARLGAIGRTAAAPYEVRTPVGTLRIRGSGYTAVFCSRDCASDQVSTPELVQDGLYVAIDDGTLAFEGRGLSISRSGPHVEHVPLDGSTPRQFASAPEFLQRDSAGAVEVAGRAARRGTVPAVPGAASIASLQNDAQASAAGQGDGTTSRPIVATTPLGQVVDLIDPQLTAAPRRNVATAVPSTFAPPFASASTQIEESFAFGGNGGLARFNAPFGSVPESDVATFLSGTGALIDSGSNGASGLRWGRWAAGTASVHGTPEGTQALDLRNASLHWIVGPTFENAPVLPASGFTRFVLAGGTSPTNELGQSGTIADAVLNANFTSREVTAMLSLDLNGYNWFASGTAPLDTGTARFSGDLDTVLIDGRLTGTGGFSGFLSAGTLTADQLNGAGLSYRMAADRADLGTLSGVLAFVPGGGLPLAPPVVQRDVAYSLGSLGPFRIVGGVAANSRSDLVFDANGDLTRFVAPVPGAPLGALAIGLALHDDGGFDAATGIRWGRWEHNAIDVSTPLTGALSYGLGGQSLHWIVGNEYGSPPVRPQTGTATYTLIGNTRPTDTLGHVGTLGTASLTANFSNRLVTSTLTLNIDGRTWYARGDAAFSSGGHRFDGTFDDVRIENLARGQGTIHGFFTLPRLGSGTAAGAGLAYNLADNAGQLGVVSGAMAFREGGPGADVTPPAVADRDIAMVVPDGGVQPTFVQRASASDYSLDTHFNLAGMAGLTNAATAARYEPGTSSVAESGVAPLVMIGWGRWAGGEANVSDIGNATQYTLDLNHRSLHWVQGADIAPPVMPVSGTAHYALIGSTSPTDRNGHVGILNHASLDADFTNQSVSATLNVSIGNTNVQATGTGSIGAAAGLASHQFSGAINGGTFSTNAATPSGSFDGFFTQPGGANPAMPGGAGLTYTVTDGMGLTIDGAAALRSP